MKTFCTKHRDQAYEVGTCCPWCEPEKPVEKPWVYETWHTEAVAPIHMQDYCGLVQPNKYGDVFPRHLVEQLKRDVLESGAQVTFSQHVDKPVDNGPNYSFRPKMKTEDFEAELRALPWRLPDWMVTMYASDLARIQDQEDDFVRALLLTYEWFNKHTHVTPGPGPLAPPTSMPVTNKYQEPGGEALKFEPTLRIRLLKKRGE